MIEKTRVYGLLEAELRKNLWFVFSVTDNLSRPGANQLQAGDRFRMVISACNHSPVPMRRIRGTITSTFVADFFPTRFQLDKIDPREQVKVASIDAEMRYLPDRGLVLDQIGTVSVSAEADLSGFRIHEGEKALIAVQPASLPGNAPSTGRLRPTSRSPRDAAGYVFLEGPTIALSDMSH